MVTWIWYIYSPLLWTSKSSEMHWIKRCLLSLLFQYLQKRQWTGSMPVPLLWTLKKASKCTLASSSLFLCSNISKNDNWPRNVCASALDLTLPSVCLVLSTPESSNVANNPSCVFAPALDPYSLKKPQKWALSVPISSKTRQKASMSAPLLWTSKASNIQRSNQMFGFFSVLFFSSVPIYFQKASKSCPDNCMSGSLCSSLCKASKVSEYI